MTNTPIWMKLHNKIAYANKESPTRKRESPTRKREYNTTQRKQKKQKVRRPVAEGHRPPEQRS